MKAPSEGVSCRHQMQEFLVGTLWSCQTAACWLLFLSGACASQVPIYTNYALHTQAEQGDMFWVA